MFYFESWYDPIGRQEKSVVFFLEANIVDNLVFKGIN